jgi:hypothetical protein
MHAVRRTHPIHIDAELTALSKRQGALDQEIGRCLLSALSARVHEHLGLSSFVEYANLRLGYSPRLTKEKLRVARALERLPKLERALATGAQTWSAARELTRVVTPQTEAEWLDAAQGKTQRELERLVAGLRPGARPTDARDPLLTPRRVVLDLPPEVYALLMDAYAQLREVHGPAASQVELTRAMAERVLGAAKAEDRPAYQIAVAVCAECQRTLQSAGGERVEVSPAIGACAACDGEVVGLTDFEAPIVEPGAPAESASELARGPTHVGPRAAPLAPMTPRPAETHGGPPSASDPAEVIRQLIHRGGVRAVLHATSHALGLGLRTVTPKVRALVLARDHHRCTVPGCEHRSFTQLHHLRPRALGGRHSPSNLVSLCSKHHQLLHDGLVAIELRGQDLEIRTAARTHLVRGWHGQANISGAG